MTTWIAIIYIARELWLPHMTFTTKIECEKYVETLQQLHQLAPGQWATCLPGTVEEKTAKHRLGLPWRKTSVTSSAVATLGTRAP